MNLFSLRNLIIGLALLLLNACGQPVCVMGIGQCAAPEHTTVTTTTVPNNTLKLTSDKTTIAVNQKAILTISGGTANYKLEFIGAALGTVSPTLNTFSADKTYTYTAPATIAPSASTSVTFRVTDQASSPAFTSITITITASK